MKHTLSSLVVACAVSAACAQELEVLPGGFIDYTGAVIYEVNLRQYTPEGTIDAFEARLGELDAMGVDILWFMPVHPIGELERKGTLGSYYAVKDYRDINPEFGDLEDFKRLTAAAHERGMLVMLDWVPNHTAWDHPWTVSNPEWYTKGEDGGFVPPNPDWNDVIDLNYDEPGLRRAMIDDMKFWLTEVGIDGFRADVAELVPADFWEDCIDELRATKPVLILAEGHQPWLFDAGFDLCYGWGLGDTMIKIYAGEADASDLWDMIESDRAELKNHGKDLPLGPQRMWFTTNHDWNSWNGLAVERFGDFWTEASTLTFAVPGLPLIYSGQEAGLEKQLEFFERDTIAWRDHPARGHYAQLAHTIATDARDVGFERIEGVPDTVFAYRRTIIDRGERVRLSVAVNCSAEPITVTIDGEAYRLDPWSSDWRATHE